MDVILDVDHSTAEVYQTMVLVVKEMRQDVSVVSR